jgi:hypothetical protein
MGKVGQTQTGPCEAQNRRRLEVTPETNAKSWAAWKSMKRGKHPMPHDSMFRLGWRGALAEAEKSATRIMPSISLEVDPSTLGRCSQRDWVKLRLAWRHPGQWIFVGHDGLVVRLPRRRQIVLSYPKPEAKYERNIHLVLCTVRIDEQAHWGLNARQKQSRDIMDNRKRALIELAWHSRSTTYSPREFPPGKLWLSAKELSFGVSYTENLVS